MKLTYVYTFILVAAVAFLLVSAFSVTQKKIPAAGNEEVIKFSHQLHADLVDCASCHQGVTESKSLKDRIFPNHDNCEMCHDVSDADQCMTCHYEDRYEPLIKKKAELIFDHSFHIVDQKMECVSCHKGFDKADYSFQVKQPHPIMEDCYSCHGETKIATNSCEACHISTANLIPQSHKSVSFMKTHKFSASAFDANCVMCHDNNSCEDCHVATTMITEKNIGNDFYMPYSPGNYIDGVKQQKISRVHDLNYRFTHGIDAKGKTADCQSCHQIETFCSSCHQSDNYDFALSGILPSSHLKPNFFTIGAGTGGGEHAILARRDIERCASCHDLNGNDPSCITCHLDSDGIKGTNPKTHASGFMRSVRGDWHDSEGSLCFNCHTSAKPFSPAGVGFCGYCHGAK